MRPLPRLTAALVSLALWPFRVAAARVDGRRVARPGPGARPRPARLRPQLAKTGS